MHNWMLIAIVVIGVIAAWFLMRKKTVTGTQTAIATNISSAPGVSSTTGEVYSNAIDPPPKGVVATVRHSLNPTGVLKNVPIIGGTAAAVAKAPLAAGFKAADMVNNSISHIPVAGKVLAAPAKAVTNIAKKFNPFSW